VRFEDTAVPGSQDGAVDLKPGDTGVGLDVARDTQSGDGGTCTTEAMFPTDSASGGTCNDLGTAGSTAFAEAAISRFGYSTPSFTLWGEEAVAWVARGNLSAFSDGDYEVNFMGDRVSRPVSTGWTHHLRLRVRRISQMDKILLTFLWWDDKAATPPSPVRASFEWTWAGGKSSALSPWCGSPEQIPYLKGLSTDNPADWVWDKYIESTWGSPPKTSYALVTPTYLLQLRYLGCPWLGDPLFLTATGRTLRQRVYLSQPGDAKTALFYVVAQEGAGPQIHATYRLTFTTWPDASMEIVCGDPNALPLFKGWRGQMSIRWVNTGSFATEYYEVLLQGKAEGQTSTITLEYRNRKPTT
jgi:hypothetical protein